jgi:two-component system sensor histidine kinase DegS
MDDLGLFQSIRGLLTSLEQRTRIKTELEVHGEDKGLPPEIANAIFRIIQEAVRNVERHADASLVTLELTLNHHEATLTINDNGVGFEPRVTPKGLANAGRFGLIGMMEHSELVGGNLQIESAPGRGTTIKFSVRIDV